ncbi:MAG: hypothetical protein ACOYMI_00025 [Phycisphaerales bacterium]|jgi:hypothetical protein
MLRNTLIASATLAVAGVTHAGLMTWSLTGTGTATGSLASLGTVTMTLTMAIDDSASALSAGGAIGSWSFQMSDVYGVKYTASGTPGAGYGNNAATYVRWTSTDGGTRRYTIVLGGATSSAWDGSVTGLPTISSIQFGYVAARPGGAYGSMGDSIVGSVNGAGGFMMATTSGAGSFGAVSATSFFIVPTPGAFALAGVAGLVSFRRRRA